MCIGHRIIGSTVQLRRRVSWDAIARIMSTTKQIVEGTVSMEYDAREVVFYNKVQVLNRDLSIQVIKLFAEREQKAEGIRVLDALAASGLRSLRYLKEIPGVSHVTINDLSPEATAQAQRNCELNEINMDRVTINTGDACMFMYGKRDKREQFDVIDLDPYGSAVPFLDSAVQAVRSGGLLCVTCTDMTVLSGAYPEVSFSKYGSVPVRGKYLHEMSLRILLHAIDSAANKYKRHIVPWLSLSVDFYVRVFVRVFESPAEVKNSMLRRCMVYQCIDCPTYYLHTMGKVNASRSAYTGSLDYTPSVCEVSGGRLRLGGPFWSDPLHNQDVVDTLRQRFDAALQAPDPLLPIQTAKRLLGILTVISEELKDVPFYYSLPELGSTLHLETPQYQDIASALENAGYRVSQFHHDPSAVKTDAPLSFMWDVMRAVYKRKHGEVPPSSTEAAVEADTAMQADQEGEDTAGVKKKQKKSKMSPIALRILSQESSAAVDFTRRPEGRDRSVPRFAPNPEEHWGPKRKAGRQPVVTTTADGQEVVDSAAPVLDEESGEPLEKRTRQK